MVENEASLNPRETCVIKAKILKKRKGGGGMGSLVC